MKGSASPRWSNNEDWNTLMMASQNALIAYVFHWCTLNIFISWQAQWTNIVTMNTAETTHIAVWFCIVMWILSLQWLLSHNWKLWMTASLLKEND